jgi:hypothetical protein
MAMLLYMQMSLRSTGHYRGALRFWIRRGEDRTAASMRNIFVLINLIWMMRAFRGL